MAYLSFKKANCKNCYRCLRECPVKAITVHEHQAKILEDLCILCGRCTHVCHQNAKYVESELIKIQNLVATNKKVIASLAPSFVSNFDLQSFEEIKTALLSLGFYDVEETAVGAEAVSKEYLKILERGEHKNLIASACPSVVKLIQIYYPEALKYLAMVDSPMVAHAKILKERYGGEDIAIVFIGPCIAKKREADENKLHAGVLTFEELAQWFKEKNIIFNNLPQGLEPTEYNKAKYYPINRGIIKSFEYFPKGYEYVSVDGVERCRDVLKNIGSLNGMFFEMNTCEFSCINGPCAIKREGGFIKATEEVRGYVRKSFDKKTYNQNTKVDFKNEYLPLPHKLQDPTTEEINAILAKIGKVNGENELNCGACGYNTCRDKAKAVYNQMAELDMCLPFMRERAESMSYEIIRNSPNGIITVDTDLKIVDINSKALEFLGIKDSVRGDALVDYTNPTDFFLVLNDKKDILNKKVYIRESQKYVEMSIIYLEKQKILFSVLKDITEQESQNNYLTKIKEDTLLITNKVIEKQMRVAQEIASLLGETTAETKVALIKLKNALAKDSNGDNK